VARAEAGTGACGMMPLVRHFALLWRLLSLEFAIVYCGADWITAHHSVRLQLYASFELDIPLVPFMVVPYMTMYAIFFCAPFVLKSRATLDRLAMAAAKVIAIAGIAFVALPARLGFPPADAGHSVWAPWLQLAHTIALKYNLVPSLHVALFTLCAGVDFTRVSRGARLGLVLWLATVAASTVLTHQHQLLDVIAGLALGIWGARTAFAPQPEDSQTQSVGIMDSGRSQCAP